MNKIIFNIVSYRLVISVVLCVGIGLVFLSIAMTQSNLKTNKRSKFPSSLIQDKSPSNMAKQEIIHWKTVNFLKNDVSNHIITAAKTAQVVDKHIEIMQVNVFYREANAQSKIEESGQTVLLLHGQAFKSETWLDLGTINILAAMGHRVIAVDLPGYGLTGSSLNGNKDSFLNDFITKLSMKNVVIVSPSMSGSYSIPFIVKNWKHISGYVPVAPGNSELISDHAKEIKIPTLIIYGELDKKLGPKSRDNLSVLPNSQVVELPKSRHPAYLDQPEMFHKLLYNFLLSLKSN